MATSWNGQINPGNYRIQFETTNKELYKLVEKACKQAMDSEGILNKRRYVRSGVDYCNWENERLGE